MVDRIAFELVSPERLLKSEPVEMVVVPGGEGDFGVLPQHAPLVSTVRQGLLRIYEGGQVKERIFVAGGFAEVTPERVTVLAEEAHALAGIERAAVEERIAAAREVLADSEAGAAPRALAERSLAVAQGMLAALEAEAPAKGP
ncbi:MAG: ATP synthase F1 subunit epsilon [Proteobacteria bacterium]|nr:ATP synthase F1 subunit epsilon [Pseudomonadota bacterium]